VPQLVAGAVSLVEDREDEIGVLPLEFSEYDTRLQRNGVGQPLRKILKGCARSIVDVATPRATLRPRVAVREGVVAVPSDDVVQVTRGSLPRPKPALCAPQSRSSTPFSPGAGGA
jgi:hypothetical protein